MPKRTLLAMLLLAYCATVLGAPGQTTKFINVDQFGYFPNARKVAVISDPQVGFNAADAFTPGTGAGQYQVRRWDNDEVVFTGTVQAWNSGATHTQSGDRGWWFDFSAVTTPGSYYLFDLANNVGSYRFDIGDNVYREVLKQAMRTFYYQRINFAKTTPYTDARWTDAAWYEGPNQDRYATSRFDKGNMATARDLHGGWMDAGDVNKYTTFAESAVIQLMEAYRINPGAFTDDYGIPESGNGVADILDEVKYELDFLKRMQDATGTHGFLLKVGVDNYNEVNPLSTDTRPKYYLPECTSATLAGAAMFAVSGMAIRNHPSLGAYAEDLLQRAAMAWARAKVTTSNFTSFQTACDDGDIKSGDADRDAQGQLESAFVAAVYLYEATGNAEYKSFAESKYTQVNPYVINWWGPYWAAQQLALLRLTSLPGVSTTVVNNIRNQKANMNYLYSVSQYNAGTDLYRSHMENDAFHWGHCQARAQAGHLNLDFITFGINPTQHNAYREIAEQYLHWFHGVNPLGMVMMSNMGAYGAEKSVNEIYHGWFTDGSVWDNALASSKGPAPGYIPGGPNKNYTGSVAGISTQPPPKAYKDWNAGYPENSWEITEPSIYNQAAYVMLLARLSPAGPPPPPDTEAPTAPTNLAASNIGQTSLTLTWTASTDNVGVSAYEVYQNGNLLTSGVTGTTYPVTGLTCNTAYTFQVKARDAAGNVSGASNTVNPTTAACPVAPDTKLIYGDAIGSGWTDVSAGSNRNFSNTSPVKAGTRSARVDFQGNGTLAFSYTEALATTTGTEIRFWVYSAGGNNISIFTQSADGTGQSLVANRKTSKNRWVEMVINRSALGNPANIKRVIIRNNSTSAVTLYFDEIRLTNVLGSTSGARALYTSKRIEPVQDGVNELRLVPNPARAVVQAEIRAQSAGMVDLIVSDVSGRRVYATRVPLHAGVNRQAIPLLQLKPGVYWVQTDHGQAVKLLVEK